MDAVYVTDVSMSKISWLMNVCFLIIAEVTEDSISHMSL